MASDFFRILRGLEIDEATQVLTGTGSPTSADTNAAPRGSIYMQTDSATNNLNVWYKWNSGTGVAQWKQVASKDYVDSTVATGVSWKNPSVVRASSTTTLPTGTPGGSIIVDGQTITNGMRVLFSDLSSNPDIYTYTESTGLFTVASDVAPAATAGAATYIDIGTSAGQTFIFNGTAWVLVDQADQSELAYIRTFIGKLASGSSMPDYTSTNVVLQSSDLVTAISALDAEIGANVTTDSTISSANTVNQNIQAISTVVNDNGLSGSASSVVSSTQLDSVVARAVKYLVHVEQVGSTSNVRAYEIFVAHNGVVTDVTRYATLVFGSAPTGLDFTAALSGGNTIALSVISTTSVNVRWKRVAVLDVA
jgi:hypothetical protein